jgi:hypothetical protein
MWIRAAFLGAHQVPLVAENVLATAVANCLRAASVTPADSARWIGGEVVDVALASARIHHCLSAPSNQPRGSFHAGIFDWSNCRL